MTSAHRPGATLGSSKDGSRGHMYRRHRGQGLPEVVVEHRRREDAAPRLRNEIAHLESLRLVLEDVRVEGRPPVLSYVKRIVIGSAPAHFEIRCMEPRCDGRHD